VFFSEFPSYRPGLVRLFEISVFDSSDGTVQKLATLEEREVHKSYPQLIIKPNCRDILR
jgi:hypothetical protein